MALLGRPKAGLCIPLTHDVPRMPDGTVLCMFESQALQVVVNTVQ